MKISESIELFFQHCRYEKNLSIKTISAYKIDLFQFRDFAKLQLGYRIQDIDKNLVKSFVKYLYKFQPRTIKRKVACTKAYLNFLEFEDLILVNPYRKIKLRIKEPSELPVILSLEEIRRLFILLKSNLENIKNKKSFQYNEKIRDLCVLEILFGTGIRVSELCGLRNSDIDFKTGDILVHGKGNRQRLARICNSETLSLINDYRKISDLKTHKEPFLKSRIGKGLSDQSVRALVSKYCKMSMISKHVTPHTFRHTFATLLLEQGVDLIYIQHLLGHKSVTTTQIYTQINRQKQLEILSKKHPRHQFTLCNS